MNNPFIQKAWDTILWCLFDPVTDLQLMVAGGLAVVAAFFALMKTAYALEAGRANVPLSFLSLALGLALMIGGVAGVDMVAGKSVPESVPYWGFVLGVAGVVLLAVVAPLTKVLLKAGYFSSTSSWLVALAVVALLAWLTDLGFNMVGVKMAKLVSRKGDVSYQIEQAKPWVGIARDRLALPIGAAITTSTNASATFDLGASSYVSFRPATIARIRAVGEEAAVELEQGRMVGSVKHTQRTKFQIRTPAANTGILGTQFIVTSDAAKNTTVTVADGKVSVTGTVAGSRTVNVNAGEVVDVPNGGQPSNPRPANPADLKLIKDFQSGLQDAMQKRNKEIEDAL